MPPCSWNKAWIRSRSCCYYQSRRAWDDWATVYNGDEISILLTWQDFCSHRPPPTPILSCGTNTVKTTHDQLGHGLCSVVFGWNLPLTPTSHTHFPSHGFCVVLNLWFWSMLGEREEVAVEGGIVGYFVIGLAPDSCPFFTLNSDAWTPDANASCFPAHERNVTLITGLNTSLHQALMPLHIPHPIAAGNHFSTFWEWRIRNQKRLHGEGCI